MQNSNLTSSIGYINNVMIKLRIYFNSHMQIIGQAKGIIQKRFHVFVQGRCAYQH
jgi:hypothetical protein